MQAKPEDKQHVSECANILEEMLQAVESDNTEGFSLVENEEKSKLKGNVNLTGLRASTASVDDLQAELNNLKAATRNSGR